MSKKKERREAARLKGMERQSASEEHIQHAHHVPKKAPQGMKAKLMHFYETKYMMLLFVAFAIVGLAVLQIGVQTVMTGDFLTKGVSLKGGITVTVPNIYDDSASVEQSLRSQFSAYDLNVRALSQAGVQNGLIIDADITDDEDINAFTRAIADTLGVDKKSLSIEIIGSALGESFFQETLFAVAIAFILMGLVVLITFRVLAPSMMIVLAAVSDILIALALTNLFGIKVSTAGIAAFLMLIGYSVDTDILLTTRILRRKDESAMDALYSAMKTGVFMTCTTIVAVTVGLIFSQSEVLKQIMLILLFGLIADLMTTWFMNAGILRWYLEKKGLWSKRQ